MKNFNFQMEVPEEVVKERNHLIKELKTHPLVIEFCNKNECSIDWVEKYPYKFKRWIEGLSLCAKCAGLSQCRQENRGQLYDLKKEEILDYVLRPCKYAVKEKQERSHIKNIVINDMPRPLQTMNIDQLEIDGDNGKAVAEVAKWLEEPLEAGFFIQGNVGTGKSTLAACACNYFARKGKRVAYVNVPNWVARMKGLFNDPDEYQKQIRLLQKVEFVVLDDLGAESVTSWVRDELIFPILNWRMEEKRWTWFTSNEDFESLYDHYRISTKNQEEEMKAVRILERIKTLSKLIQLNGKNRRKHAE